MAEPIVVEWTREQVKYGIIEMRAPNKGGRPITIYAQWGNGMDMWFEFVRETTP